MTGLQDFPVELLVDIFSWLVPYDLAHASKVSHFCAHWHTVALDAPSLVHPRSVHWLRRRANSYLDDCITALHMIDWGHVRVLCVHAIVTHPIMKGLEVKGKLHIIHSNLDKFEILSDDRVYAKVAAPIQRLESAIFNSLQNVDRRCRMYSETRDAHFFRTLSFAIRLCAISL
jgi:F-box-like